MAWSSALPCADAASFSVAAYRCTSVRINSSFARSRSSRAERLEDTVACVRAGALQPVHVETASAPNTTSKAALAVFGHSAVITSHLCVVGAPIISGAIATIYGKRNVMVPIQSARNTPTPHGWPCQRTKLPQPRCCRKVFCNKIVMRSDRGVFRCESPWRSRYS
jgi:hypothetical protein